LFEGYYERGRGLAEGGGGGGREAREAMQCWFRNESAWKVSLLTYVAACLVEKEII